MNMYMVQGWEEDREETLQHAGNREPIRMGVRVIISSSQIRILMEVRPRLDSHSELHTNEVGRIIAINDDAC